MPDSRSHSADLMILPLDQFQADPDVWHVLAKSDGRHARRQDRLRIEQPRAAGQRLPSANRYPARQFGQRFRRRDSLHLRPIDAEMAFPRMEQPRVEFALIAEEKQPLALSVEPSDGIHALWEAKIRECPMRGAVRRKLGDDAVRFVKSEEHGK